MSAPRTQNPNAPKVSPARTVVSLILLLIVGAICVVELRAGLGHMWTTKALAGKSEQGTFEKVPMADVRQMLAMGPSESVQKEDELEITYKFEWMSLLRPLMGESSPVVFIVASKTDPPLARAFFTEAEEDPSVTAVPPSPGGDSGMPQMGSGMGMGGPGMGGPGMGGGARKGDRPPVEGEEPAGESSAPSEGATPAAPPAETPAAAAEVPAGGDAANPN